MIAIGLLAAPSVIAWRGTMHAWALVPLGLALLLTFSRSAWVGTAVAVFVVALLRIAKVRSWRASVSRQRGLWFGYAPPLAAFLLAAGMIVASSGAVRWATATITGADPSSASRVQSVQDVITSLFPSAAPDPAATTPGTTPPTTALPQASPSTAVGDGLFGRGLGTAGPLSTRFGETGPGDYIHSEMWYANYFVQAGIIGSVALGVFVLIAALQLLRARRHPWATAAMAVGAGLAVGALVIPVIDSPAVAIPLASVVGLALASTLEAARPVEEAGSPTG